MPDNNISVAAGTIPDYEGVATVEIRVYNLAAWATLAATLEVAGSPYDCSVLNTSYRVITATVNVSTHVLSYAASTLTSTTDALVNPYTRLGAFIFDTTKGRMICPVPGLESFEVPTSPTATTFARLAGASI